MLMLVGLLAAAELTGLNEQPHQERDARLCVTYIIQRLSNLQPRQPEGHPISLVRWKDDRSEVSLSFNLQSQNSEGKTCLCFRFQPSEGSSDPPRS